MNLIEEYHEFTWDMVRALPKAYHIHNQGLPVEVKCKPGLSELYYFADKVTEVSKFEGPNDKNTYNNEPPNFALQNWTPPPLKEKYNGHVKFKRPTVTIQNKYALEWNTGIYNYFPLDVLGEIFEFLKEKYDIIYIRPKGDSKNYYKDENEIKPFNDYEFIQNYHPYVYTIEQFLKQCNGVNNGWPFRFVRKTTMPVGVSPNYSYNTIQMILQSTSDKHITVSGGNACLSAYFGGDVFIFDSPKGGGAGRGVWKDNSWLSSLGNANIFGFNSYDELTNKVKSNW
jgi:hypothetical protein